MRKLLLLSALVSATIACDDGASGDNPADHKLTTVVSTVRIGSPAGAYAFDLDNDGEKDDRLGDVAASIASAGDVDLQAGIDAGIASGETLLLVEVASHDATFANDSDAVVTIYRAVAGTPDFGGAGAFIVDTRVAPLVSKGRIVNRVFTSFAVSGEPQPLDVGFGFASGVFELPIIDVQASFVIDADAKTLGAGKLGGAVPIAQVQEAIIPLLAESYNAAIAANPASEDSLVLLGLFDDGGDGACGIADNGLIEACEIASNAFIQTLFRADVAILANGVVAPSASRTPKDCMSLGVGFSAVGATF